MLAQFRRTLRYTPIRFLLVGVVNTFAGLGTIYALKWLFGVHDVPANFAGYAVGLTVSYLLNSSWTFAFRGGHGGAALRFVLVVLVAYLANLATTSFLIYELGINSYLAQALGIPPYTLINYLGCKLFVFAAPPHPA